MKLKNLFVVFIGLIILLQIGCPAVTPDIEPATPEPGEITVVTTTDSTISLTWTKATDTDSLETDIKYQLYYSTNSNISDLATIDTNGTKVGPNSSDNQAFTIIDLTPATSYYVTVLAEDETGEKSLYAVENTITLDPEFSKSDILWSENHDHDGDIDSMIVCNDGSIIVAGGKDGDLFLGKYDSAGNLSWNTTHSTETIDSSKTTIYKATNNSSYTDLQWQEVPDYDGISTYSTTYGLSHGSDDSILIAGKINFDRRSSGGASFDQDIYFAKFNMDGDLIWSKILIGSDNNDVAWKIRSTSDNGYIICGSTNSEEIASNSDINSFVLKLEADGSFEWLKIFLADDYGENFFDVREIIEVDSGNNYLIIDTWAGTIYKISGTDGSVIWSYLDNEVPVGSIIELSNSYLLYGVSGTNKLIKTVELNKSNASVIGEYYYTLSYNDTIYPSYCSTRNLICKTSDGGYILAGRDQNDNIFTIKLDSNLSKEGQAIYSNSEEPAYLYNTPKNIIETNDGNYLLFATSRIDPYSRDPFKLWLFKLGETN